MWVTNDSVPRFPEFPLILQTALSKEILNELQVKFWSRSATVWSWSLVKQQKSAVGVSNMLPTDEKGMNRAYLGKKKKKRNRNLVQFSERCAMNP
jgi:hypothetical protein